ncbi:MAG: hypothetical protein MK085_10435 [Phycisphaerales bacterium]|nr:hypothetical protein [Phycisphaerales bacterium]
MRIRHLAIVSTAVMIAASSAFAGDADEVTLRLDTVQAKPGETVTIPVSMVTTELVGGFDFTLTADGNTISDIGWDGPLFSNGWTGWENSPNEIVSVSAACIFNEDQVGPGDHLLINAYVDVPANAQPGSFISFEADNTWFVNYGFEFGAVIVENGGIEIRGSADLSGDGIVGPADLGIMLAQWGSKGSGDLDGNGFVNGNDLGLMLSYWGTDG